MRYIKRPIPVEAIQTPLTIPTSKEYFKWYQNAPAWLHEHDIWFTEEGLVIPTLEGDMNCYWGNYIICGIRGEIYPCDKEVFEESYDPYYE